MSNLEVNYHLWVHQIYKFWYPFNLFFHTDEIYASLGTIVPFHHFNAFENISMHHIFMIIAIRNSSLNYWITKLKGETYNIKQYTLIWPDNMLKVYIDMAQAKGHRSQYVIGLVTLITYKLWTDLSSFMAFKSISNCLVCWKNKTCFMNNTSYFREHFTKY